MGRREGRTEGREALEVRATSPDPGLHPYLSVLSGAQPGDCLRWALPTGTLPHDPQAVF